MDLKASMRVCVRGLMSCASVRYLTTRDTGINHTNAPAQQPNTVLLLDHPNANLGFHIGVEPNRHAIDSERLDRFVQVDLSLFYVEALRFQLLRNVRRGHGPEQLSLFANARGEGQRDLLEALRERLGGAAAFRLPGVAS